MTNLIVPAQIIVAISVYYVWIFRFFNVEKEFKQFGLSDLTRSFVCAAKISLATILIAGIWYPELIAIPSAIMGLFMIVAQYFHFKVDNPFIKKLPSLLLLILCLFLSLVSSKII